LVLLWLGYEVSTALSPRYSLPVRIAELALLWLGYEVKFFLFSSCQTVPLTSIAEPELVERQLFARAGAEVVLAGSGSGYVNSYKMFQKALKFS
jgi:hypothetical protein